MSTGPEQRLWNTFRPQLALAGIRALRVENMLDDGFPDVVLQYRTTHITLMELKARPSPADSPKARAMGASFGLRLSQRNWWLEYTLAGGRRGLIVSRVGKRVFGHSALLADAYNGWDSRQFEAAALASSFAGIIQLIKSEGWER